MQCKILRTCAGDEEGSAEVCARTKFYCRASDNGAGVIIAEQEREKGRSI